LRRWLGLLRHLSQCGRRGEPEDDAGEQKAVELFHALSPQQALQHA
jgi:hypothetical protein